MQPKGKKQTAGRKCRIAFIHPDLGLGGAERLVVDAGVGLQNRGYEVTVYTGYHDKNHAFPETTDGTLNVVSIGQWIPRSVFGLFVALMAFLKMCYLSIYLTLLCKKPEVIICDQVSVCVPILKMPNINSIVFPKVLFYCHYPDQLLSIRKSFFKRVYRFLLDWLEEITTNFADKVLVNSEFTRGVVMDTFKSMLIPPEVLYPSINTKTFDDVMKTRQQAKLDIPSVKHLFVSINRFEPKKAIELAIRSLRKLRTCLTEDEWNNVHLVVAGGYDPRLHSSVIYLEQLKKIVADEGVVDHVTFMLSPKDAVKVKLLAACSALIYTPSLEHFGIVPLEAMYMGKPVIAVNSGGPRETVLDNETGFLCPATESHFAVPMARIVKEPELGPRLGKAGKQRFMENFSFEAFTMNWDRCVAALLAPRRSD